MISRGDIAIVGITVPFALLAVAVVAMGGNFIAFAAFFFPLAFGIFVLFGFGRASVRKFLYRPRRRRK